MSATLLERARALASTYADSVNRQDGGDWAACWSGDAVWELSDELVFHGRSEIVEYWHKAMAGFSLVVQSLSQGFVSDADGALTGRWAFTEHAVRTDGTPSLLLGHYEDEYQEGAEGLQFARRRLVRYFHGAPDLSSPSTA